MSYILDALLKADEERQRQKAPSLNTVQLVPLYGRRPRWPAVLSGAALLIGLLSLFWGESTRRQLALTVAPVTPVSVSPLAVAPPPPIPDSPGPVTLQSRPLPPAPNKALRQASLPVSPKVAVANPGSRLYSLAELPAGLQKVAQTIAIAGFSQAADAGGRMAIINDRVLREGDEVTEGLRVEKISDDGVMFNLKGYRFRKGGA